MSALRFAAGIGAGVALAALLAGAVGRDAPGAAGLAARPPPPAREEARAAAPAPPPPVPAEAKGSVAPGVLVRAAASRRAKAPGAKPAAPVPAARRGARDAVIESVEVDWGAAPARP